jgi:hypothetical protein
MITPPPQKKIKKIKYIYKKNNHHHDKKNNIIPPGYGNSGAGHSDAPPFIFNSRLSRIMKNH